MKIIRLFMVLFLCTIFFGSTDTGFAQQYPAKPIRVIVPFTPGGSNDLVARALQKPLGKALGGTIVVENIPGGSTRLATVELMKAAPDGYTLMHIGHVALMGYYYSGTYDSKVWEKMTIIAQDGDTAYGVLDVRADSPFKTWGDLVSYAQKNPGKLSAGGPAAGGMLNLIIIETAKSAGIDVKYVPFPGANGGTGTALLGGHIDYRVASGPDAYPNIKNGKTRGLAVSYSERLPQMPDVPTFKELGLPEYPSVAFAFWGPTNMPPNIVNQISKAVEKAVKDPDYIQFGKRMAWQPLFKDAQTLKKEIKSFEETVGPRLKAAYSKK